MEEDDWILAFHAGERSTIEQCYRDHHRAVAEAIGRLLPAADAETVTHEVFYRLLWDAHLRENFHGGRFAVWLVQVARNRAIDHLRRRRREQAETPPQMDERPSDKRFEDEIEAKLLVERFQRECLTPKLTAVFEARFLGQLTQREAASRLGIRRTTLIYQEHRIRTMLSRFLLRLEGP